MLHFKSCPKCVTGTVEHNNDSHGAYAQCLNCGFMRDLSDGLSDRELTRLLAAWRNDLPAVTAESVDAVA
ncbi:MAG: hypothetical protein O6922_04615 [Chloroflexi bacterium]|nr:hypothetical protein [Chloroflexota bacterium]